MDLSELTQKAPLVTYLKVTFAALLVGAFLYLGWALHSSHTEVKALEATLAVTTKDLADERSKLEDLAVSRKALVASLKVAQAKASQVRKESSQETQRILMDVWPSDCEEAAAKAYDEIQRMKGDTP